MYKRVPASGLRLFRLMFGLLLAFDIWDERNLKSGFSGDFLFIPCRLPHVDCPLAYPTPTVAKFAYWIALYAALGIAFDILYPITSTVHFLLRLWIFNLDRTRWNNHSYNWVLMTFLLCVMGRSFSGPIFPPRAQRKEIIEIIRNDPDSTLVESLEKQDVVFGKHLDRYTVPVYIVALIRAQIYMWAAFVKLEQDWLDGSAFGTTMNASTSWYTIIFMSYSGLFIDFSIPVAMCLYFIPMDSPSYIGKWLKANPFFRQALKFLVFTEIISFNTINHITHHLGIFSVSMLGSSVLFMNTAAPIVLLEENFDILGPLTLRIRNLNNQLLGIRFVVRHWLTTNSIFGRFFLRKTKNDSELGSDNGKQEMAADASPPTENGEMQPSLQWRSWRDDMATRAFIVIWILFNSITASTRVWYAGLPNGGLGGFDGPARGTWDMFLRNERWQHGQIQIFDPISGRVMRRNPISDVHRRGIKNLFKRPDITYLYMKCVKKLAAKDLMFKTPENMGIDEFSNQLQVKIQSWLSINGRPFQRYVVPEYQLEDLVLAKDADSEAVKLAVSKGFYPMSSLVEPSPLPPCPFCNKVLSYYGGNRRNRLFEAAMLNTPLLLDMNKDGRVEKYCRGEFRKFWGGGGDLRDRLERKTLHIVHNPQAVCKELWRWQQSYKKNLISAKQYSHGVYAMIEQPHGIFYGRLIDQIAFMEGPGKLVVFIYSQMRDFKDNGGVGEQAVPRLPEGVDINNPETLPPYVRVLEKIGDRISFQKYPGSTDSHRFKAWTVGGIATFMVIQENTWLSTFRAKKGFLSREEQDVLHITMDVLDKFRQQSPQSLAHDCSFNEDAYILVSETVLSAFGAIPQLVAIANSLSEDSSDDDLIYVAEQLLEIHLFPTLPDLSMVYDKLKPCIRMPLIESLLPMMKTLLLVPFEEGQSLLDGEVDLATDALIAKIFNKKAVYKSRKPNVPKPYVGEKAYFLSPSIIDWPLSDDLHP